MIDREGGEKVRCGMVEGRIVVVMDGSGMGMILGMRLFSLFE